MVKHLLQLALLAAGMLALAGCGSSSSGTDAGQDGTNQTCTLSAECGGGKVCCTGTCYAGACCSNSDCGGHTCANHTCACTVNADCSSGDVCCSGSCYSGACCTNSACGGRICFNHACVPCSVNDDCGAGQKCCSGTCFSGDCCISAECGAQKVCENHICHASCTTNVDCPGGSVCCTGACYTGNCCTIADCTPGLICAENTCAACTADAQCNDYQTCSNGTCVSRCCNGKADTVDVKGKVLDITTQQGIKVALTPISAMDAFINASPTHLDDEVSGTDGTFACKCFDVTNVSLGLVILADDVGFDGAGGTYFPTGTFVKAWSLDSEKVCVNGVEVFAVPNTLVTGLNSMHVIDAAGKGFIMGFVVDTTGTPIAGAKVVASDSSSLTVIYPNATFTDFSGTSTAAMGVYIIPQVTASPFKINIQATGHTFGDQQVGQKPGFCFFAILQAKT